MALALAFLYFYKFRQTWSYRRIKHFFIVLSQADYQRFR